MPTDLAQLLVELEEFGRENDASTVDRRRKMLNLERETATLIHILVRASIRKNILEIGTSNAFSTLWLADAIRPFTAAHITSIERDPMKLTMARHNVRQAGFEHIVTLLAGEASEIVKRLHGPYDCVFFDADRVSAPEQLQDLLPKLSDNVFLLCDNVLSHPAEVASYLAAVQSLPGFSSIAVLIGKGLHIAFRHSSGETVG
ncbi:MAG: class I SAM-dependent methyltransferase [Candidatus Acidiferrum sp.]